MKTSSRHAPPRSSACGLVSLPLLSPLELVIRFVIRFYVIITSYTVYFTICRLMCET
jgi:hypothetical protein